MLDLIHPAIWIFFFFFYLYLAELFFFFFFYEYHDIKLFVGGGCLKKLVRDRA